MEVPESNTRPLKRLLRYLVPHRKRLALAIICMVIYSVVASLQALLIYNITAIAQSEYIDERVETNKDFIKTFISRYIDFSDWSYIVIALPLVFTLIAVFGYLHRYLIEWIGKKVVMNIRNKLYSHLHTLSLDFFSRSRTGELISRVTNDVTIIETSISRVAVSVLVHPLMVILLLIFLFRFSWVLALVVLIGFPLIILPILGFGRKVKKNSSRMQRKMADITSILQETLSGIRVVKAFSMQRYEIDKFERENEKLFRLSAKIIRLLHAIRPFIEMIGGISLAFVILFGIRALNLGLHDIFGFAAALYMIYEPMKKMSQLNAHIQMGLAAAERVFLILDARPSISEAKDAKELGELQEGIKYKSVNFSYNTDKVLDNIGFEIRKGEIVALVGPSGAGKTTIANLLLRFYDPDSGAISIDNNNLCSATINSLRQQLGIVTQETILFNDTVQANIAYGKPDMPLEKIEEAARAANAHDFITELPEQYDTMIGERGVLLSGGQRQRLAIARAILKNPPILILDEATSSLDTESERLVQTAIDRLMRDRTVLVIAHRLSTIQHANKIIVLDRGRIIQQGNHEELLKAGGLYKKLYDMQFNF